MLSLLHAESSIYCNIGKKYQNVLRTWLRRHWTALTFSAVKFSNCIGRRMVDECHRLLFHHHHQHVTILGRKVDVVDSFVYLGSSIDASGGNDSDIRRRIEPARTCMKSLDWGIWRSSISPSSDFTMFIFFRCS